MMFVQSPHIIVEHKFKLITVPPPFCRKIERNLNYKKEIQAQTNSINYNTTGAQTAMELCTSRLYTDKQKNKDLKAI